MSDTLMLLRPRPDVCQHCATDHPPEMPHNAHSLYYQFRFNLDNKRGANWIDAMAHCSDQMRREWTIRLGDLGIDVAAGQLYPSPKPEARTRANAGRQSCSPSSTCEAADDSE